MLVQRGLEYDTSPRARNEKFVWYPSILPFCSCRSPSNSFFTDVTPCDNGFTNRVDFSSTYHVSAHTRNKVVSGFEEMGAMASTHGSREQMLFAVVSHNPRLERKLVGSWVLTKPASKKNTLPALFSAASIPVSCQYVLEACILAMYRLQRRSRPATAKREQLRPHPVGGGA